MISNQPRMRRIFEPVNAINPLYGAQFQVHGIDSCYGIVEIPVHISQHDALISGEAPYALPKFFVFAPALLRTPAKERRVNLGDEVGVGESMRNE